MFIRKPKASHITLMVPVSDMALEANHTNPSSNEVVPNDITSYVHNNLKGYPVVDIAYVIKSGTASITMEIDEDRYNGRI